MLRVYIVFLLSFTLVACGTQTTSESNDVSLERQEGVIALKKENEEGYDQVLLIPEISEEDIEQQSTREIIELAQNKNGAYYAIEDEKTFNEIEVGDTAVIYWNGNQSSSHPPQCGAERLEIIESLDE
ncbi:Protein of unknown function [Salimicrobium halophilum]|uniref:DUF3221 domain-containing protein n=1 Tax=Salimicrobium halophilum TaxID=86666 RepID=A0A1G8RA38_9BACI|nr:Protein of unknown function [Salimicrobium halophilum]